jgi:hypothetical protein
MPTINQIIYLDVTPERFLNACCPSEILETALLLNTQRFQQIIKEYEDECKGGFAEVSTECLE